MGLLLYGESFVEQQPFLVFAAYRKDITSNRCRSWNVSKQAIFLKIGKLLQIDSKKHGKMLQNGCRKCGKMLQR